MTDQIEDAWRVVDVDVEHDATEGLLDFLLTVENKTTGDSFFVCVSGNGKSKSAGFVGALVAAAGTIAHSVGGSIPGVRKATPDSTTQH